MTSLELKDSLEKIKAKKDLCAPFKLELDSDYAKIVREMSKSPSVSKCKICEDLGFICDFNGEGCTVLS